MPEVAVLSGRGIVADYHRGEPVLDGVDLEVTAGETVGLTASTTAALVSVVRAEAAARGVGVLAITHDEELLAVWADRVVDL